MNLFRRWFSRHRLETDLSAEMCAHLDEKIDALIASGMSRAEATQNARREFGNLTLLQERSREVWRWPSLESFLADIRFAFRMLRKSPGFAAVAVLTLALGIGANTAIFSVVNSVLLKPLPYPNANRLAMVFLRWPALGIFQGAMGNADFTAFHQQQQSFTAVAAFSSPDNGFTLTGSGEAIEIPGSTVTSDFFSVLGEKPLLGRTFLPKESDPDQPKTVVVSYEFWQQHLGSDPAAIGRAVTLAEDSYTVIGVMPADFHFGDAARDQLWPILQLRDIHQRAPYNKMVIGRLKPGVSLATAGADETRIAAQVARQYPQSGQNDAVALPMKDFWVGKAAPPLLVLLGAVFLVLLIAVVNVANLQIARAAARQREMAIRSALGAGWSRLARQLLTESILLGAIGAVFGLWLAYYGLRAIKMVGMSSNFLALSPQILPRMNEIAVDWRVLVFTAVVALVSSVLFGLVPVLGLRSQRLDGSLKQSDRSGAGSSRSRLTQSILVVSEFSLALLLIAAAGLFLRSLLRAEAVSPGFQPAHIIATQINLPPARYGKPDQVTSFYRQLLDKLDNTPGVEAAGLTLSAPPNLLEAENPFHLDGQSYEPGKSTYLAEEMPISENYFRALGVPLISGRFFNDQDRLPTRHELIINRAMAEQYFHGSAVGQRVQTGDADPKSNWYTIVGVVGDVKYEGLTQKDQPTMYVPMYDDGWNPWFTWSMFLLVHTRSDAGQIAPVLREAVASLDRDVPLSKVQTMDDLLSQSVGAPRFGTVLVAIFAMLALVLAAVGIYGVMSYTVTRRTREIGIMIALGAQRRDVLKLILGQSLRLALLGAVIGIAAAFAVMRFIAALLFSISPTDPLTFALVAILLMLVALLACYIPARRAMKVDPIVALRYE
jgi:predicted permease